MRCFCLNKITQIRLLYAATGSGRMCVLGGVQNVVNLLLPHRNVVASAASADPNAVTSAEAPVSNADSSASSDVPYSVHSPVAPNPNGVAASQVVELDASAAARAGIDVVVSPGKTIQAPYTTVYRGY